MNGRSLAEAGHGDEAKRSQIDNLPARHSGRKGVRPNFAPRLLGLAALVLAKLRSDPFSRADV